MKKLSLPLLLILFLLGCQKQMIKDDAAKEKTLAGKPSAKINVCHYDPVTGAYTIINLNLNAWPGHQAHGDVRLDDQDGDGYVPANSCGFGKMGDCDDVNTAINPGSAEICGNGVDDNCNGMVDEGCLTSVSICGIYWMDKNFEGATYRNGDVIPQVTDAAVWATLTTGAWCWYNNDPARGAIYGKLYNYYAVADPRGIAPTGWHVPDFHDFDALKDCEGGVFVHGPGGNLKEAGTAHWLSPNEGATNSSGFTALPGGRRNSDGSFAEINERGTFWTTLDYLDGTKQVLDLYYSKDYIPQFNAYPKETALSLRLVKD